MKINMIAFNHDYNFFGVGEDLIKEGLGLEENLIDNTLDCLDEFYSASLDLREDSSLINAELTELSARICFDELLKLYSLDIGIPLHIYQYYSSNCDHCLESMNNGLRKSYFYDSIRHFRDMARDYLILGD